MNVNYFYYKYHNEKTIQDIPTYVINFYDLTLVLDGTLHYKLNNKHLFAGKNDIILIPPNTKRERLDINHPAEYVSFNFYSDTAINLPLINRNIYDVDFFHLIQACNTLMGRPENIYNDTINNIIQAILSLINNKLMESRFNPITKKIIKYINDNYKEKLTLRDICAHISYSESYCSAIFKKDTGYSILNYCLKEKISKAKILLLESNISIKEIALFLGFEDQNYFSRTFKNITKISPLTFKKRHQCK